MSVEIEYIGYFKSSNLTALTDILTEVKNSDDSQLNVDWSQEGHDVVGFRIFDTSGKIEKVWQKFFLVWKQIIDQADEYLIIIFNDHEETDFPMIGNISGKRIKRKIPYKKYFKELRSCGNNSYTLINLFVKQLKESSLRPPKVTDKQLIGYDFL